MSDRPARGARSWLSAVFFALLLGVTILVVPAFGEDASLAAPDSGAAAGGPPRATVESLNAEVDKALAEDERRRRRLEGEAATAEREASQDAFRDDTRVEAEALLRTKFDGALEALDSDAARLLTDVPVEGLIGHNAARIPDQDGSGGSEIVEASAPVEDRVLGGAPQPVDLSLRPVGDDFVAENPIADVQLPAAADEALGLGNGIAIADLPGEGDAQASRFGDKDLFYAETAADTDTLVAPISGGVEVFNQLRSPESPEDLRFGLHVPEGAVLLPEGEGAVIRSADGEQMRVPAPTAVDAQGAPVPVEMTIEGDSLLLHVAHREADVAYPVLVDPAFIDEALYWASGYWGYEQVGGGAFYGHSISGSNIHVNSLGSENFHPAGSNGHYYLSPLGTTSYISGVGWGATSWEVGNCFTQQPHGYWGIANTDGSWASLNTILGDRNAWGPEAHTGWVGHPGSRWAVVGVGTTIDVRLKCAHQLNIAGATVTMDDNDAPSIGTPSGPGRPVGSAPAPITVPVSDSGLGLSRVRTEYGGNYWDVFPSTSSECGSHAVPCTGSWTGQINYNPAVLPEGNVTLTIRAIDAVDNAATRTLTITVDHTAPGTVIDSGPANNSAISAATATFTFHATETGSTFQCKFDSGSFAACSGSGYTTPSLANGSHELQVRATDQAGNTNNAPTRVTFYKGPPDTVIDSGPSGLTNDETPSFSFHATQIGATFECRVDAGAYSACNSGEYTASTLGNGNHTFEARATNSGLPDATPASRSFTVDTVPPSPDIVGGPTGPTNKTTPTFSFTKEAGVTAVCSIDTGAASFGGCTGPTTHQPAGELGQQTYLFRVRESDAAGNEATVKRSFTVDTVAPQTTIESGPSGVTRTAFPEFSFDSSEAEGGYECEVDSTGTEPCAGEDYRVPDLADGRHKLEAAAEDEAGNVDPTPAVRSFTVDTTAPGASIQSGPSGATSNNSPTFVFSTDPNAAGVKCAFAADEDGFDVSDYRSCATATTDAPATALADGGYTFYLQVTDAIENENTVTRHFTVDTVAPQTSIVAGPEGPTDDPQPIFGFAASEAKVKYECRFDSGAFGTCAGPGPTDAPPANLADGEHTFAVRATDRAGGVDQTPAVRSFTVDTKKPQTTIETGPNGPTLDATPAFTYAASEPASFQCKVDSASFTSCPNATLEISSVPDGQHTVAVRALDAASNPDPTPAQRTFVVDTGPPSTPVASGQLRDPETPGVTLSLDVSDGNASAPATIRSGIKEVEVSIDGDPIYTDTMPCVGAWKTCPDHLSRQLELPYQNVLGTHVYTIDSTDALGHPAPTQEWTEYTPNDGTVVTYRPSGDGCGPLSGPNQYVQTNDKEGTMRGGPQADLIVVKPGFHTIYGGGNCDVIIGGFGRDVIRGEGGHDLIRGNRSNDIIFGDDGNDQIFGGIGDDELHGNGDDDYIDGGPGADKETGEAGNDTIRGGQGIDQMAGQGGNDTASFADSVGPGFPRGGSKENAGMTAAITENLNGVSGFPGGEKTGVFVNLNGPKDNKNHPRNYANNGGGPNGGGMDYLYIPIGKNPPGEAHVDVDGDFENIVGSAFADLIRGSGGPEEIWGGPGPDIIRGGGGADKLDGGLHGDFLDGAGSAAKMVGGESTSDRCVNAGAGTTVTACGSTEDKVVPRVTSKVAVGIQDPDSEAHGGIGVEFQHANLFVAGSPGNDSIAVDYQSASKVVFTIKGGAEVASNICGKTLSGGTYTVTCDLEDRWLGSVVILGGDGNDEIKDGDLDRRLPGSVIMLGGPGSDTLEGRSTDELLLDGDGHEGKQEELLAGGGDDVVIQGDGSDRAMGGNGNDLIMSSEICHNDAIIGDAGEGDTGSDNAQFHPVQKVGVFADLGSRHLGQPGQKNHTCPDGNFDALKEIDDLEGSPQADMFEGNGQDNLLLGRGDPDVLKGFGGKDTLNARDEAHDNVIDCGGQTGDVAHIDNEKDNQKAAEAHCDKVDHQGVVYLKRYDLIEAALSESDEVSSPQSFTAAGTLMAPAMSGVYPLDEESGVVADNVVEGAEDGTYENADIGSAGNEQGPVLGVEGADGGEEEGSAAVLDGVNDYIELGEEPPAEEEEAEAEAPEGFSVEMWVNFDQLPEEKEYLYSGMDEAEGPFLYRAPDGSVVFGSHTEAGTPEVTAAEPIEDGEWHQVVGTLEGEEIALYVDGFPHRMNYGQPVLTEESEPEEEVVGASSSLTHFLDGAVDDVVLYEEALPQDEVAFQLASSKAEAPETLLAPVADPEDSDGDSVGNSEDNCAEVANTGQGDADLDGTGDACVPPDSDGDAVPDAVDNCPDAYNPEQVDRDEDGLGVECDENELPVVTGETTSVAATAATVSGTIDPEGAETAYRFEYGTTTSYGSKAPATAKPIGAGIEDVAVSEAISGLQPGTVYHYRLVASGEAGTTYGKDRTLETKALADTEARLAGLALTEPFDGGSTSLASFGSSWSPLGWAGGSSPKGGVESTGWHPVDAYSTVNGAFYNPPIADTGWGTAAAVRMGTNPSLTSRYFSIWLDMPSPASATRAGYELRFADIATDTYTVTLSKWVGGTATQLASIASYAFVNGSSFALVDQGGTVSAWTNAGSGYTQLLSAADGTFDGGKAGIEGSGNITRLNQFKAGPLRKKATAVTGAATNLKTNGATLNGTVNPEGLATAYQFEYGPTAAYGSRAPAAPASAGAGSGNVAAGQAIGGLEPGTTYHYRLVATSEAGTSYGEDRTLTTLQLPRASTDAPTALKPTRATLNGTVNPEGLATTYQFEYGPTAAYGSKAPAAPASIGAGTESVGVGQTVSGLSPATTYHYRVVATSAAGTSYGEDQTLETRAVDIAAKLAGLGVTEVFDGGSTSLASFGSSWSTLGWAGGTVPKGADMTGGWGPSNAYSTVNGTFYNPPIADTGWGTAAAVRMGTNPSGAGRYFSIWLDMPSPASATRAGYELRFTYVATNAYDVTLSKWDGGVQTQLASKAGYGFVNGNSFALVDLGGTVSAWTSTGSGYTQLLSAGDSRFEGGEAGLEGSGNITRLNQFRVGGLNYPTVATAAASEVKSISAVLNGSVDPEGLATTYQFEYGPTTAYGSRAPASPTSAGSGNESVGIGRTVTGLTPGATYHYRLVATSEAGIGYGEDRTLTTVSPVLPTYRSAFGSTGSGSGQFIHPAGIAVDSQAGFVWVIDQANDRVQKFGLGGEYLGSFGSSGAGNGQFGRPTDIALGANGTLFVTDAENSRIEKFNDKGEFLAKFGSQGSGNGQFNGPESVATDGKGNVWVGDTYNGRLQKFTEAGEFVKVVGSYGSAAGQMIEPTGVDIGLGGRVWVADWGNNRVSVFNEAGEFVRQFGSEGTGNGQFQQPDVIEVDYEGRVWVGDQNNGRIQQFTEAGGYVNQFGSKGTGTGQFTFSWPMGIASDSEGDIWVADTGGNRVQRWSYGP